jgi:cytochrome c peroxidase
MADFDETLAIATAIELAPVALSERDIAALLGFLETLTDRSFETERLGPPETVPSGLPVQGVEAPPS